MAVTPTINATQRCKDKVILLSDTTEIYDATINTTGYGSPNEARADITATTIEIKAPDGNCYRRVNYDSDLELYNTHYFPTTKGKEVAIKAHEFVSYNREAEPVVITGDNAETATIYSEPGTIGNVRLEIKGGSITAVGSVTSTTDNTAVFTIMEGVTTMAQLKTLLLTHDAIANVIVTGSNYTLGDSIIEATDGSDYVSGSTGVVLNWLTSTTYSIGKYVYYNGILYKCLEAHTSGTFSTDLTANKWVKIAAGTSISQLGSFTTGCYKIRYRLYKGSYNTGVSLTEAKVYCVHSADPGEYATYNSINYNMGDFFRANSTTAWTSAASVRLAELAGEVTVYFMYWCNLSDNIKSIILKANDEQCDKSCDFVEALSMMETELSSVFVALEEDNTHCACDGILDVEKLVLNFINRCC